MTTKNQAQKEGRRAHKNGKGILDNLYVAEETRTTYPLSLAWQKGYGFRLERIMMDEIEEGCTPADARVRALTEENDRLRTALNLIKPADMFCAGYWTGRLGEVK